jgi:two-component system, NarL family, invasion response regulator UvrY
MLLKAFCRAAEGDRHGVSLGRSDAGSAGQVRLLGPPAKGTVNKVGFDIHFRSRSALMRILIADDHALMRHGLKRILAEEFPPARFGEASSVAETLKHLQASPWDLLLLDIFMPDGHGLTVLSAVTSLRHRPRVLVVTGAPEDQFAARVFQAGASGILEKSAAGVELVRAVHQVMSGARYASQRLAERLLAELGKPQSEVSHGQLSDREFQVLHMLVAGRPQKEIAALLSLNPKTISTFHRRILKKLHLQNDLELIQYAIEHRLLERGGARRSPL